MSMAQRIKEERLKAGLTQEELANKLGLKKSAIAKYENGRVTNLKKSTIEQLSKIFNCRPAYLMGYDDYENSQFDNISPIHLKKFPVLGEIACGEPVYCNEDRESYISAGSNIKADFCLQCKGDSMINARINSGDYVFIRKQSIVNNGEIAAVVIDEEATLKRVFYYPEQNMVILKPENPKYADLIYQDQSLNDIYILGKAVAFQSDVV
ncbi:LexA family transcriptional regulator [Eubacterium sp.]|uniref:LexA family protein n=1 Tax=Eubacterium sp. TaxID=142586 RepID=UPI0026DFFE1E|nr:S24 family peptidase [Eubacterium sp.]MDO5433356.1 S24 family peptidase [Eubacterium sp.]